MSGSLAFTGHVLNYCLVVFAEPPSDAAWLEDALI
jgi:hypothetical protein